LISRIRELDGTTKTAANENKAGAEKQQNRKDEPDMKDDQQIRKRGKLLREEANI
jgi:hypothetical protein